MHVFTAILWFALGVVLLLLVLDSALRTFVLPRGEAPTMTRAVFIGVRWVFNRIARMFSTYEGRDRVMALYAPIGLFVLPFVWLVVSIFAFTAMFHALGVSGFERAFEMSGSSLPTLGFVAAARPRHEHPRLRRGDPGPGGARAADQLPPDDLRGVLPTRGARGAARRATPSRRRVCRS